MEKLHKSLMTWATEEMRFQTTAYSSSSFTRLPLESDFEQLCQRPLDDVWKYVVKHVRSKQTVKEIKGNIELNRKLGGQKSSSDQQKLIATSAGENKLQQEKAALARELASCVSDVNHLLKEIKHITNEVMDAELAYQSVGQRVQDLQKKESILEVVNKCAEEKVAKYSEYDQRVMKRFKKINKKSEGQGNYVTRGVTNKVGDLETECCRDVRLGCEAIGEFLHRIVDGSLADNFSLEMAQKQLWENVEKAASDHNVSALLSALVTNTEYAAKDLKEKTQHINIIKDAEALSFAYDRQTGLHDLSSPVSVKKCVEELLLAGNEQHGMRWFKEQEHLNEEWKLSARRDDIMMDISKQVHRIMGNDARNVQLANSYIDAQIQLAEERSVVPCLQAEVEVLMNRIQKAKQERKELRLKHDKIQDFRTLVEKKQNIIGTLVRQNSGALARLDTQKKQVMGYILSRSMNSHATEVHHLTDDLKNSLLTELMKFTSMELACFVTVLLDSNTRQCVLDLSIAPSIHPLARKKLLVYTDVSAAIGFPEYKSTDSLFLHVLQIHDNIQDLDLAKQQRESSVTTAMAAANTTDDISSFVDLCLRAKQHDEKQCEKFLPKLQKRLDVVSAHVNRMVDVKKQVNDWWERPAQFTTPWVVTEGMTFIQWMQRWRVAVTQLHKKTLNDKSSQKKV